MNDRFSIRGGPEYVARSLKRTPQWLVIVDFAVENDDHRSILIFHRLCAAAQIDNAQPSVTKAQSRFDMEALTVRTTVSQRRRHFKKDGFVDGTPPAKIENSSETTHGFAL
jgi:hypothetical protein